MSAPYIIAEFYREEGRKEIRDAHRELVEAAKLCRALLARVGDGSNPHTAEATRLYGILDAALAKVGR